LANVWANAYSGDAAYRRGAIRRKTPRAELSRGSDPHHLAGMTLDLTDEEATALAKHLQAID
jgi:hypothetical protein